MQDHTSRILSLDVLTKLGFRHPIERFVQHPTTNHSIEQKRRNISQLFQQQFVPPTSNIIDCFVSLLTAKINSFHYHYYNTSYDFTKATMFWTHQLHATLLHYFALLMDDYHSPQTDSTNRFYLLMEMISINMYLLYNPIYYPPDEMDYVLTYLQNEFATITCLDSSSHFLQKYLYVAYSHFRRHYFSSDSPFFLHTSIIEKEPQTLNEYMNICLVHVRCFAVETLLKIKQETMDVLILSVCRYSYPEIGVLLGKCLDEQSWKVLNLYQRILR
jgi:hypothetical protein